MATSRRKYTNIYTPISLTVKQKKKGEQTAEAIDSVVFATWKGDRRIYTPEILKVLEHLKMTQLTEGDKKISKIELFQKELIKIGGLYKIKIGIYEENSTPELEKPNSKKEDGSKEKDDKALPKAEDKKKPPESQNQGEDLEDKAILYTYVIANNLSTPREICDKLYGKSVEIANTTGTIIFAKKI